MPRPLPPPTALGRDGTSQSARVQPALDPGHVAVDERTPRDWLGFARALAARLRFVDPARPGADLDWRPFLPDDLDLGQAVAYLEDPSSVPPAVAERLGRPHLALLLAFLRLLGHARDHVNALTRRHLEFYYEDVLRLRRKPPTPDRVDLVFRPASGVAAVKVPAGSELLAGKSRSGAPLVYRTDRDLVVTRAQVAELRSVYVDQRVTGIREANERRDPGTDRADRFVRMFAYALGEPGPGDPLPPYAGEPVTLATLVRLGELARFAPERLYMELYELRAMVQLVQRRAAADPEWAELDRQLERIGRRRTGDPQWQLAPADPRAFDANLTRALGAPADADFFAGLPEVQTIDDLHTQRQLQLRERFHDDGEESDVDAFIRQRLFCELAEFDAMMALKTRGDGEWRDVNRTLERAGQRRRGDRAWRLDPADRTAFAANFAAALVGPGFAWPPGVTSPETYHAAILALEAYFHMSAEAYAYVAATAPGAGPEPTPKQWDRVYAMLTTAHQSRVHAARRAALAAARTHGGLHAMLSLALGVDPDASADSPLPQLAVHLPRAADHAYLVDIEARVAAAGGDETAVAAAEWERVTGIVELAQRAREQLPPPVPRRILWRNLYPQRDATAARVTLGLASDQAARWQTFGARPSEQAGAPPPAAIGWAIASPMLALAEGERTITLTLGLDPAGWSAPAVAAALAAGALAVEVTTAAGWTAPDALDIVTGDYTALTGVVRDPPAPLPAIRLTLTLAVDADPLVALPAADSGVAADQPALRLSLAQIWDAEAGQHVTLYEPLRRLGLVAVHLRTHVLGLAALRLQNDHGNLDYKRPFEPFGPAPAVGSRLRIGHPELVRNRLAALTFRVEWMGAPADLAAHYANYDLADASNGSFTATVRAVDRRRDVPLVAAAPLFAAGDARKPHAIVADPPPLARLPDPAPRADLVDWPRRFEWELTPQSFQHDVYPRLAARKGVEMAAEISAGKAIDADDYQLAPPYTPKIKRLTVDYASAVEVVLADAAADGPERLFHVRPFGSHRIEREEGAAHHRLFPAYDDGGELYIGLRGVVAPQQLALLLQLADGSADPDLEPVPVEWSYLSGDRWRTLHAGDVLRDGTRGLLNSGILELSLPAAQPSTQLPGDLYWLRASIARQTDSVCDVVDIRAQAVSATFVDDGAAPEHYEQPLPPASVRGLVAADPRVGGVEQPYTSYGGRPAERPAAFYTRVSERLRHKQRALTVWDYERLVLERFPQVYKVKCLPADPVERPDDPGRVELVVIPDIRDKLPFDPFEPKAPADLLADIERHLAPLCPTFAAVRARNARYVAVKARFGVRFVPGLDVGFHLKLLNDELCRFLSPWAYDDGADLAIGGRIYASSVVDFVDRRPYVDYVATIKLFRSRDGRDFELVPPPPDGPDGPGYAVATERADEVLVAAREHDIDVITEVQYDTELLSGLAYMKVELDFVIG